MAALTRAFGDELSAVETDLLNLASVIYAADIATRRGERENYIRDIELEVGVANARLFRSLRELIEDLLYVLTDDNWRVSFGSTSGGDSDIASPPPADGKTLLFSGGLDSFSAAIEEMATSERLQLVSHVTGNQAVRRSQEQAFEYLKERFPNRNVQRLEVKVSGQANGGFRFPKDSAREPSQRSRSLLFLTLAAIVARRTGCFTVVAIAENGQMAVHLPLSAARIGAFSTRTAHPEFIVKIEEFLRAVLEFDLRIENPFLYRTKAECLDSVLPDHAAALDFTISCWRAGRSQFAHCGECAPCLVRRIAVEYHGCSESYRRDLLNEDVAGNSPDDEGKRNLIDIVEFASRFSEMTVTELEYTFPDLINPHFDKSAVIDMYKRFSKEATAVFAKYQTVMELMQ